MACLVPSLSTRLRVHYSGTGGASASNTFSIKPGLDARVDTQGQLSLSVVLKHFDLTGKLFSLFVNTNLSKNEIIYFILHIGLLGSTIDTL